MDHMNKIFLESVGTFFDFIGTEWGAVYLIASIVTVSAIIAAIARIYILIISFTCLMNI